VPRGVSRGPAALLLLFLLVLPALVAGAQPAREYVVVDIQPSGAAFVTVHVRAEGAYVLDVYLVGVPDLMLGIIAVDEKGNLLPVSYDSSSNSVSLLTLNSSEVTISYVTNTITVKYREVWLVNFTSPLPAEVLLPPNATLSGVYTSFTGLRVEKGRLLLEFPPGAVMLSYVLIPTQLPQPPKPAPSGAPTPAQPASPPGQQPAGPVQPAPQPEQPGGGVPYPWLAAAIAVVILASVVVALMRLRRKAPAELSETDLEILRVLQSAGGGMFQSELGAKLNLPTTTLWRRLRRLQELGYVVIERRSGKNYVRLA
jgi:uncharacterized membrane protein